MIAPRSSPATVSDVARHYDDLAWAYQQLWGYRLHHGYWDAKSTASVEDATKCLLKVLTTPLQIQPGESVIDIGCGSGDDARWIATERSAQVSGITLSPAQPRPGAEFDFVQGDWLQNSYPENSFDVAVAIESYDHMPDKPAFFRELARTLRPGGRAAIACWTVPPDLPPLESLLIRRLCQDGALPSLGTRAETLALAEQAGLLVPEERDLTSEVEQTWWRIGQRALIKAFQPTFLYRALHIGIRRPSFALTIPAMILAFRTGALSYNVLWLENCTPTSPRS